MYHLVENILIFLIANIQNLSQLVSWFFFFSSLFDGQYIWEIISISAAYIEILTTS